MQTRLSFFRALLGLALLCFSVDSFAQPPRGRGFMPNSTQIAASVDTMAMKLKLNKEQKEKLGKIYFASFAEARKAFEQNAGDFQAIREARMKINEKRDNEVKALLNEEQKKIYDKLLAEQEAQRRKRMEERGWRN